MRGKAGDGENGSKRVGEGRLALPKGEGEARHGGHQGQPGPKQDCHTPPAIKASPAHQIFIKGRGVGQAGCHPELDDNPTRLCGVIMKPYPSS